MKIEENYEWEMHSMSHDDSNNEETIINVAMRPVIESFIVEFSKEELDQIKETR